MTDDAQSYTIMLTRFLFIVLKDERCPKTLNPLGTLKMHRTSHVRAFVKDKFLRKIILHGK